MSRASVDTGCGLDTLSQIRHLQAICVEHCRGRDIKQPVAGPSECSGQGPFGREPTGSSGECPLPYAKSDTLICLQQAVSAQGRGSLVCHVSAVVRQRVYLMEAHARQQVSADAYSFG